MVVCRLRLEAVLVVGVGEKRGRVVVGGKVRLNQPFRKENEGSKVLKVKEGCE